MRPPILPFESIRRPLRVVAVAALACGLAAHAGEPGTGAMPSPAAPASLPLDVNPMTGTPLALEALRRRLAEAQVQARIEAELTNIERSRSERRRLGQGDAGPAPPSPLPAAPAAAASPRAPAPPSAPRRASAPPAAMPSSDAFAVQDPSGGPARATAGPRLLGVIEDGRSRSVLVEAQGRIFSIAAGDRGAGVRVGEVDRDGALIDDRPQRLPAVPNRIALPAQAGAAAPVAVLPPATNPENPFPGLNLGGAGTPAGAPLDPLHEPPVTRP